MWWNISQNISNNVTLLHFLCSNNLYTKIAIIFRQNKRYFSNDFFYILFQTNNPPENKLKFCNRLQGLKSNFASWEQRRVLVCFLPIFEFKPLNLMILQHTKVIPLLDEVYLPGKRDPFWEQCSHASYTFQALDSPLASPGVGNKEYDVIAKLLNKCPLWALLVL